MDKSFTLMKIAAVAIVIAVVVAAAIMITDGGKARFNKATRQLNSATSEFDNPALQAYEGSEYSGAEVINAINKYAGKDLGIIVRVRTNKRGRQFRAKYNNDWPINETASFSSEIIRDKNNNITGMIFQQDGIEEPSSLEDLDGMVMSGEEAIKVIEKYRTQLHKVRLYRDPGDTYAGFNDYSAEQSLAQINKGETYTCFVINDYTTSGKILEFAEQYRLPLLYDGAILTGQEVIDILDNCYRNHVGCEWITQNNPDGFWYYMYYPGPNDEYKIEPSWLFEAKVVKHAVPSYEVTALSFQQITQERP